MNWEKYIPYFFSALTSVLLFYFLQSGVNKNVRRENGKFQLRLHKLYFYMGILSLGIALVFLIGMIMEFDFTMLIVGTLGIGFFSFLGFACYLNYRNHYLIFDEKKIVVSNWKNEIKETAWENISDISFSHTTGFIKLIDNEGNKIKISQHFIGLKSFLMIMENKTQWTAKDIKLPMN